MMRVEAGEEILTDSELALCANVLDASSAALRKGEYRPRTTAAELEESLGKFQELYKAAAKSEAAILDMLQELNPSERYRGRYLDEQTATRTAGLQYMTTWLLIMSVMKRVSLLCMQQQRKLFRR